MHACAVTVRELAVRPDYYRTILRLEDDGITALDWFRWRECRTQLPDAAPVLLVAHSMAGTPSTSLHMRVVPHSVCDSNLWLVTGMLSP